MSSKKAKITATNSKTAIGQTKVGLGALPSAGLIHGAIACKVGNDKYGFYNYRDSEVSYMMYLDAIERHRVCVLDGEDFAADAPLVHHLGFIIAGASILLDAIERGNVLDDRPPKGAASQILERYANAAKRAKPTKRVSRREREAYIKGRKRAYKG